MYYKESPHKNDKKNLPTYFNSSLELLVFNIKEKIVWLEKTAGIVEMLGNIPVINQTKKRLTLVKAESKMFKF